MAKLTKAERHNVAHLVLSRVEALQLDLDDDDLPEDHPLRGLQKATA